MAEIDSILLVNSFTTESHRIINSELDPKEFVASLYEPEGIASQNHFLAHQFLTWGKFYRHRE